MWTLPLLDVDGVALLEARGEPHPSAVAVAVIVAGQCHWHCMCIRTRLRNHARLERRRWPPWD